MKNKVDQQPNKDEKELSEKVQQDFVVKNMPSFSSLSGTNYEDGSEQKTKKLKFESFGSVNNSNQPDSYRKTGIIIISAGVVIIMVLLYLAYRFLIAPSLQPEPALVEPVSQPLNVSVETDLDPMVIIEDEEDVLIEDVVQPVPIIEEDEVPADTGDEDNNLELPLILDSDDDGLSDIAESFLGTDPYNSDTDGDDYSDKDEILNGYNPVGSGLLVENNNLSLFIDSSKQYSVVYPKTWEVDVVSPDSVLFAAPDQDFIQISYEDSNQVYASIIDWYQNQFLEVDDLTADRLVRSSFGPGIISPDQQFVYFLADNGLRVFVMSYIPAGSSLPYLEIFQMMIATFMRV